jgi:holo-[acyl-carrier protein] synthase
MRIGVDMVEIDWLARLVERSPAFARRTFSMRELSAASRMQNRRHREYLAGRFAVKEAALKALGVGLQGDLLLNEIETINIASGAPKLVLVGRALKLARREGIRDLHVSISHELRFAVAFVVLS